MESPSELMIFDHPLGPGALTGQLAYNHFDGGTRLTTLPKQNDWLVEAGYLINALKLTPLLEFARRDIDGGSAGDETITSVGANYYWAGLNTNLKARTRGSAQGVFRSRTSSRSSSKCSICEVAAREDQ
jgi:hypothetical protein